jgi:hypothetical protein
MSKFCPLCNAVTNCTDNCQYCLEQEEKERENKNEHANVERMGR